MGECRNDMGGYFIINGKEKTVVSQEKFSDNMLYIRKYEKEYNEDEDALSELDYLYSAEIRSVSENVTKPTRTLAVKIKAPDSRFTNKNILVFIPNVRQPIPLFIVFRALGVVSDKDIVEMCLLDMEKYESFMDLFIPSVHDAGGVMTQKLAIQYISTFTKGKKMEHVLEILCDYFLSILVKRIILKRHITLDTWYFACCPFRMDWSLPPIAKTSNINVWRPLVPCYGIYFANTSLCNMIISA